MKIKNKEIKNNRPLLSRKYVRFPTLFSVIPHYYDSYKENKKITSLTTRQYLLPKMFETGRKVIFIHY